MASNLPLTFLSTDFVLTPLVTDSSTSGATSEAASSFTPLQAASSPLSLNSLWSADASNMKAYNKQDDNNTLQNGIGPPPLTPPFFFVGVPGEDDV